MEKRIAEFIRSVVWKGNIQAYTILANIAIDMAKKGKTEDDIKNEISRLLTKREKV